MTSNSASNAPLGVEIVHCKCGLEIVSYDRGNNSMFRLEHWNGNVDENVCILNAAIIIVNIIMLWSLV